MLKSSWRLAVVPIFIKLSFSTWEYWYSSKRDWSSCSNSGSFYSLSYRVTRLEQGEKLRNCLGFLDFFYVFPQCYPLRYIEYYIHRIRFMYKIILMGMEILYSAIERFSGILLIFKNFGIKWLGFNFKIKLVIV